MTKKAVPPAAAPPSGPSPQTLAEESRWQLAAAANAKVAERAATYFKDGDEVEFYGLTTPTLRALERSLFGCVRRQWTVAEATEYCALMLLQPELEAKGLGLLLLSRFKREFSGGLLGTARNWLAAGLCANWATTDSLCSLVIAEVLRRFPGCIETLPGWAHSRKLWVRRAAAVSLTGFARRGEALDTAYAVATALLGDDNDLIHKASGWLLREAGKADSGRLERFLLERGPRVPRTTLRYAIERLSAARRKQLLAKTRG